MEDYKDIIIGSLIGLFIAISVQFIVIGFYNYRIRRAKKKIEKAKLPFPECRLGCDVNQCDTWCMAKQRFKENPPTDEY